MFFPTSMIALMVPFRTFYFLDFLAHLLQKSISVASNLFACCVFCVHVSAPYSKILWTKACYISFLVLWRIVLLHKAIYICVVRPAAYKAKSYVAGMSKSLDNPGLYNSNLLVLVPNIWTLPHLQRTYSLSLCCALACLFDNVVLTYT
jgi:hypothetical protein